MLLAVISFAIVVAVVWVMRETRDRSGSGQDQWPLLAKPLLTEREMEFYQCLEATYPEHRIFVQVALSQLLEVVPGTSNRQAIRNGFKQLVADFVLCRADLGVAAVIEVDDSSHSAADRRDADGRKEKALRSAGLRLIRIPEGRIPGVEELRDIVGADVEEMSAGAAVGVGGYAPLVSRAERVALLRPVLGLLVMGLVLFGGWFAYSHLIAAAVVQVAASVGPPKVQTRAVLPALAPVPAAPVVVAAVQEREKRQAEADLAIAVQGAADAEQLKAAAWARYYQAPAACEHPPAWADQVECGNLYIRAKREFEKSWEGKGITGSGAGGVGGGR